jgi:hypothetical protein
LDKTSRIGLLFLREVRMIKRLLILGIAVRLISIFCADGAFDPYLYCMGEGLIKARGYIKKVAIDYIKEDKRFSEICGRWNRS